MAVSTMDATTANEPQELVMTADYNYSPDGTSVAFMTAELYVIADANTGGNTASGATIEGFYTKIGNVVHIYLFYTNIDTTGLTSTNDLYFRGLPYSTAAANKGRSSGAGIRADSVNFSGYLVCEFGPNDAYFRVMDCANASTDTALRVQDLNSGNSDFFISATYFTDA